MKMCQRHWDQMRAKLDELGIGHIGANNAEDARRAIENQVERGAGQQIPNDEWDPLMAMNWAFFNRALEVAGLAAMAPDFGCPLCSARASYDHHDPAKGGRCGEPKCQLYYPPGTPPHDEEWIRGCGEAMRAEAVRRGLVANS